MMEGFFPAYVHTALPFGSGSRRKMFVRSSRTFSAFRLRPGLGRVWQAPEVYQMKEPAECSCFEVSCRGLLHNVTFNTTFPKDPDPHFM